MAWYDTGTVSVTNGSTTVTGAGTNFVAGVQVGEGFYGPDGRIYEIQAVVSATALTLADPYLGATQTGQDYKIVPTQSLVATLASQVSTLISDFQGVVDEAGEGKFDDGTAASAGITFLQDQDTGFFRPAANQIGMTTSGVQRALLTSTGLNSTVIGATTPAAGSFTQVDVTGPSGEPALYVSGESNTGWGLEINSHNAASASDLVLNGNAVLGTETSLTQTMPTGGYYRWMTGATSNTSGTAGATEVVRITGSGDVGIGTSSPDKMLHVSGGNALLQNGTGNTAIAIVANNNTSLAGNKIAFFGAGRFGEDEEMAYIKPLLTSNNGGAGNVQLGHLSFGTSGAERVRIDQNGYAIIPAGVTLGTATGVYSAAKTLDDYEEGTWTPVITDGTNNATALTAVGTYTKTGDHVHVQGRIRLSSLGAVSGAIRLTGLPFSSKTLVNNFGAMTVGRATALNLTSGTTVCGDLRNNVSHVLLLLWDTTLGNTTLQATEFSSDGDISFSMDYLSN